MSGTCRHGNDRDLCTDEACYLAGRRRDQIADQAAQATPSPASSSEVQALIAKIQAACRGPIGFDILEARDTVRWISELVDRLALLASSREQTTEKAETRVEPLKAGADGQDLSRPSQSRHHRC